LSLEGANEEERRENEHKIQKWERNTENEERREPVSEINPF
jgi:hypothetical protein